MHLALLLSIPPLLVLSVPSVRPSSFAGTQESERGNELVRVELLCDRAAIRAGETFTLAAKLKVERGWHVYWENPGDSGIPTRISIHGSPGFSIGDALFPAPEREEAEGDIVTFVHKGEVLFLAEVRAPKDLPPGSKAEFDLDAHWLVCQETCYPGAGKAHLDVPIAAAGSAAAPANEKLFAEARARIPKTWSELQGAALEWSGSGAAYTLRIDVPNATALELFPLASRTTRVTGTASAERRSYRANDAHLDASGSGRRLTVELAYKEIEPAEPPRLQGVLAVTGANGKSSYRLDTIRTGATK